ncbi:MAG: four helix bundle protein [Gallionella sp.]|jgi:four helix bundle protein
MSGKIERFEDLIAWQKARLLTVEIYRITVHGEFAKDFGLRDQIRRAAVSVMSNIAEGFDRASRSEFHQFLVIAKASCAEVRSQLYVAQDVGYIDQDVFSSLNSGTEELSRILGGLRAAVQKQRDNQ